jgi:hypothetical protein
VGGGGGLFSLPPKTTLLVRVTALGKSAVVGGPAGPGAPRAALYSNG